MELPPVTSGRLFDGAGFLIRNTASPVDALQRLQKLLFIDRTGCGVDRSRLLRRNRRRQTNQDQQAAHTNQRASLCENAPHVVLPAISSVREAGKSTTSLLL